MADRYDHAGVFGDGQELPRKKQPTLWMLPAYERLDTRDGSCLEIYLRLVMQQQLVAFKSISQLAFQGLTLDGLETHVWGKELVIIAPIFLGAIHRRVGILEQRLTIFTVAGVRAYADAHGNSKTVFADAVLPLKLGDDLCGANGGIFHVCDL